MLVSRVKTNHSTHLVTTAWKKLALSIQPPQLYPPNKGLKAHTFRLGLSSIDTGMPDDPLMLQNYFIDFAVEHFGGCTTEPGYVTGVLGNEI